MRPGIRTLLSMGLALALAVLSINAVIAYAHAHRLAENNRRVLEATMALHHLGYTLSTLKDAETGQRGYLLTGQASYLEPYETAIAAINGDLRRLHDLLDDSEQLQRVGVLESRIEERLTIIRQTLALRKREGLEAATQFVLTGQGKQVMDEIRQLINDMEDRERDLLTQRIVKSEASLHRTTTTFTLASIVAATVIILLYLLVLQHLTTLEQAKEAMRDQLERWQVTLSSVGDAVIVTDPDGRVTFLNPLAAALCGQTSDEAAGKPLGDVFRIVNEETREPTEDPVAKVLRDGLVVGLANHTVLLSADGTERPIHDSAAPIKDHQGQITGVVLVFRDDTDRRRYEQQLLDANRRKDEFLAMLAHELRNPLATIRAVTDLSARPGTEDQLPWAQEVISRQVNHLAHLLDDLLDVSRITRGLIQIRPQLIQIAPVIDQAIEVVRPLIDDRKHHLEVTIPSQPLRLKADPIRLEQILVNLLTNAAKYTPSGGRIWISAEPLNDQIVIRVRDTGVGIPPEDLPLIFDLFAQGDRALDRSEGGLGVGLTIVKKLVELHGGSVSATSRGVGQGSEFTVRFPAVAFQPTDPPSLSVAPTQSQSVRILIVDDNRDLAQGLGRLLRLLGHKVELAFDGPEGIEAARSYQPEVVLLDIGLPTLDGYEVARQLRLEEPLRAALIIAISGYGQAEDRRRSLEAGMDHHLTKPVDVRTIVELMARSNGSEGPSD